MVLSPTLPYRWPRIWVLVLVFALFELSVAADYNQFMQLFDESKARLLDLPPAVDHAQGANTEPHTPRLERRASSLPLVISSSCTETVWPGILTQSGTGPPVSGFALDPGSSKTLQVSHDWQGRVWGRTNCSFKSDQDDNPILKSGRACFTGDCGPYVQCKGTGEIPATLAEFAFTSPTGHAYYDISLVDGYNLGMEILSLHQQSGITAIEGIPTSLTDPVCIGNPSDSSQPALSSASLSSIAQWCPFNLIVNPPSLPAGTVYLYPDGTVESQSFDPCYSACGKTGLPQDCCTGAYNDRTMCTPNDYAKGAKSVCPDAYSYAFDDQASTFIIPSGGGFEIRFCPTGQSTSILSTKGDELRSLAARSLPDQRLRKREGGHDWTTEQHHLEKSLGRRHSSAGARGYGSARSIGGLRTDSAGGIGTGGFAKARRPGETVSWVPFVSIAVAWWMVMDMKKKRALKQGEAEKRRIQDFHDAANAEEAREARRRRRHDHSRRRAESSRSADGGRHLHGLDEEALLHDLGYSMADLERYGREIERSQRGRTAVRQHNSENLNPPGRPSQHQPQSILRPATQFFATPARRPSQDTDAEQPSSYGPNFPMADLAAYQSPAERRQAQHPPSQQRTGIHDDGTQWAPRMRKRAKRVSFSESEGEEGTLKKKARQEYGDVRGEAQGVQVHVRMLDGHDVEKRRLRTERAVDNRGCAEV